jgi:hypothetical protein
MLFHRFVELSSVVFDLSWGKRKAGKREESSQIRALRRVRNKRKGEKLSHSLADVRCLSYTCCQVGLSGS